MTKSEIAYGLTKALIENNCVSGNYDDGNKSMANEVVTIYNILINDIDDDKPEGEEKPKTMDVLGPLVPIEEIEKRLNALKNM